MSLTKRTVQFVVIGLLMVAAITWATLKVLHKDSVMVLVQTVAVGNVESVVANTRAGTVNACRRAKLAPAIGGKIQRLPVHKGDRVKAGQVFGGRE